MYWYRLAAKGGSTEAMGNLALRYEQASRLPRDKRRALALYKRGAELGDAWCQNNLACRYWDQGDDAKAMLWIRKAARGNGPKAQFNLGMAYLHGEGTRKNHRWAALWLQRAADNGHAKAKRALGRKAERTLGSAG